MSPAAGSATGSRSSSPATPEASDSADPVVIQNEGDFPWGYTPDKTSSVGLSWDDDSARYLSMKSDDDRGMSFEDLIQEDAYHDSAPPPLDDVAGTGHASPASTDAMSPPHAASTDVMADSLPMMDILVASMSAAPVVTKPEPPPASRPRQKDPLASSLKVVHPPKEACHNLAIMTPNIPESGTKSRVETQIRVALDLAYKNPSSEQPYPYDRVGSWKWLKLPKGTSTKKRTRKEGKIDPSPEDMLYLGVEVTCATPPHTRVVSCHSCQTREAKRVARKIASRIRPPRSDSDSLEDYNGGSGKTKSEESSSLVQFNCPEVMDFSTGTVILPVRITCYCRHHREKTGFLVHFTMMDGAGRIVATGTSPPIMITDDHKSTGTNPGKPPGTVTPHNGSGLATTAEWALLSAQSGDPAPDSEGVSKRRSSGGKDVTAPVKKRAKPYERRRGSRKAEGVSIAPSPLTSEPNTRSASPQPFVSAPISPLNGITPASSVVSFDGLWEAAHSLPSPPTSNASMEPTLQIPDGLGMEGVLSALQADAALMQFLPTAPPSPASGASPALLRSPTPPPLLGSGLPHGLPFMFFGPDGTHLSAPPVAAPVIHRVVPNKGPTHGGTDVTILGANFHASMDLRCVFGDAIATSTQRWSDNTLVCVVPPRATPGVVAVWFDGAEKAPDGTPPAVFTYEDDSDRALMELALQVLGLKLTGKVEDAKNVALRIMGNAGTDDSTGVDTGNMMQVMSASVRTSSSRGIRRVLLNGADIAAAEFEELILNVLSLLDVALERPSTSTPSLAAAVSLQSQSGQTLLHLAASFDFVAVVRFLIEREIDLDVRDRNGCTALHFAALAGAKECSRALVAAGADMEIANGLGQTPDELAPRRFFEGIRIASDMSTAEDEAEEADSGDADIDSDTEIKRSRTVKRPTARRAHSGHGTGATVPPEPNPLPDMEPSLAHPDPHRGEKPSTADEKNAAASYADLIQRTVAQLQRTGIIPQLPLQHMLHLPNIPGMRAVPWAALPQIPMVFPIFIPTPAWRSFLGEKRAPVVGADGSDGVDVEADTAESPDRRPAVAAAMRTAHEWRAFWEKLMAQAMVGAGVYGQGQEVDEPPPPVYTPRDGSQTPAEAVVNAQSLEPSTSAAAAAAAGHASERAQLARRLEYVADPVPDQVVNAYEYRPAKKQSRRLRKKEDRMLVLFWIPMLFVGFMWALATAVGIALQGLKTMLAVKTGIHL